jgi:predicted DNA-binding antitoxin AbrB/MazE fold protein
VTLVVKVRGILEVGVIRLKDKVDLPVGTELNVMIEADRTNPEVERRGRQAARILDREWIDVRPLTVRDLIEEGRDR